MEKEIVQKEWEKIEKKMISRLLFCRFRISVPGFGERRIIMKPVFRKIEHSGAVREQSGDILPTAVWFGGVTLTMLLFGLTMLYSTSFGTDGSAFFLKQLQWAFVGGAGALGVLFFGYKRVSGWSGWMMGVILLLLIVADFCFPAVNGAHRWIKVPGVGNIQPSEYAKVVMTLFLAKFISDRIRYLEKGPLFRFCSPMHSAFWQAPFWSVFVLGGCCCGIVMAAVLIGHDFGTTFLLILLFFALMYIAGVTWKLLLPLLIGPGVLVYTYLMNFDPMRRDRLTIFLDPEPHQMEEGYQLWNSLLALGSGSWTGLGFTESRMKMKYLPEAHTDFILSIVGEELGLVSLLLVLGAYALFLLFSLRIARYARTRQGMLIVAGCATFVGIQACINIGVICGALPTKGMPAPFISYGGSSLVTCLVAAGLILSVAFDSAWPDYQNAVRQFFLEKIRKWNVLRCFKADSTTEI